MLLPLLLLSLLGALWPLQASAQTDGAGRQQGEDEEVPPLVLPELKALPGYSFRGPFPDNSKLPGFELSGQATRLTTSADFLRLTPPIPLSNGAIFSSNTVKAKEWVVEIAVRLHGQGSKGSRGGRGWGFWYTKGSSPTKGQQPAAQAHTAQDNKVSFFGQSVNFDGLGIIFDSAPSAPLLPRSDPAAWTFGADHSGVISALLDDGKTGADWYDDHKTGQKRQPGQEAKYLKSVVGECEAAFRNAPGLVWVRIAYINKMIRVDLDLQPHTTLTPEKRIFSHHCFTVNDISLPTGYYFGLSGLASGNVDPDIVDIYAFDAWEVTGKNDGQQHSQPALTGKTERSSSEPLAGTDLDEEVSSGRGAGSSAQLQEIIAAQARMTEAVDALARRIDALQNKLDSGAGAGSAALSSDHSRQLSDISAAVSRLTGQNPSQVQSQGGLSAEEIEQQSVQYLVKMITRLSSDVNAITIRLDNLTTRTNKNIATIINKVGEVFTLTSRSEKLLSEKAASAAGRGWNFAGAFKWTAGLAALLLLLIGADRLRKGRLGSSGGRGRKMI